jgi:archaellum biogenesis protein FlaJ (TadC family)
MKKMLLVAAIALLISCQLASAQQPGPPEITSTYPPPDGRILEFQPNITVAYSDVDGIDLDSARIIVDGLEVTSLEETEVSEDGIVYRVPEVFALGLGNHTATVHVSDALGNEATFSWNFTVVRHLGSDDEALDPETVALYGAVLGIVAATVAGLILQYMRKKRGFTYRKFLAQHPKFQRNVSLFLPAAVASIILVVGLAWLSTVTNPNPYAYEYLLVSVIIAALGYYSISTQRERRRIARYERAFAQFLFEMADAMRGGIDPTKAVIEMAKTESGILRGQIRAAADNLRVGRSFESVMDVLAEGTGSPLVKRYASLIGESSKIGGEVALVLHRAAKDMDDMIKIGLEKRRQLSMQSMTIYIAVAVLSTIVFILIDIYPTLGSIDMSILGMGGLEGATQGAEIATASFIELKRSFFHMSLVNAFGAGLLIGKTVDGRVKYGLIYSLLMVIATVMFFVVLIL